MKKTSRRPTLKSKRTAALLAIAVVLVGGSFAVASGSIIQSGSSLVASVTAAITGRPTIIIGTDSNSPRGTITMGTNDVLAIYDVSARNVTHWATVKYIPLQVQISMPAYSPLTLSNITMMYNYCIPAGATYGYGYRSSGCGAIGLVASSVTKNGNSYTVTFGAGIPIYPQESSGTFTLYATPEYSYTGSATHTQTGNASLQVRIAGIQSSGDQCQWTYNSSSRSYGYTGCVAYTAIVNVLNGLGNTLTVLRPYGYGYLSSGSSLACKVLNIYAQQVPGHIYYNLFMQVQSLAVSSGQTVAINGADSWNSLGFTLSNSSATSVTLQAAQTLNATALSYIMQREMAIVPVSVGGQSVSCQSIGSTKG